MENEAPERRLITTSISDGLIKVLSYNAITIFAPLKFIQNFNYHNDDCLFRGTVCIAKAVSVPENSNSCLITFSGRWLV